MPELPDLTVYVDALRTRIVGASLERIRIASPFVLRTVVPAPEALAGRTVDSVRLLGKRIVVGFEGGYALAIHLMVAGRLRWRPPGAPIPKRNGLAALDFAAGTVLLSEASRKQRAALHLFEGEAGLDALDAGGIDVLEATFERFRAAFTRERHTLKRALTDPRILSGIGNAYSDEILHAARLSPFVLTANLDDAALRRLHQATHDVLEGWIARLRAEPGDGFPERVTAFRDGMAVHGRYRQPCPDCGAPVQRIRYAENEANYCATCQTEGRVLADRALSRLLREDWPRSIEEWESRFGGS
jgi:formamidopyrimidine-DNA glycosylase